MNNIEFKEYAVCYANGKQWGINTSKHGYNFMAINDLGYCDLKFALSCEDFQLNEPREGYFIPKSELDAEEKYNQAVEVFGLFGYKAAPHYKEFDDNFEVVFLDENFEIDCVSRVQECCKVKLTFAQLMAIGELKRKMNKQGSVSKVNRDIERAVKSTINIELDKLLKVSANKYEREIIDCQGNTAIVDVYDVLKAFEVTCPATQHAVKKLLCSGLRGHKDLDTDLVEAKDSITRAIELNG